MDNVKKAECYMRFKQFNKDLYATTPLNINAKVVMSGVEL